MTEERLGRMRMNGMTAASGPSLGRRGFLGSAAAFAAMPAWVQDTSPRLVFGILSDMHVTVPETCVHLEKALRYFREQDVDAVVFAGDMIDDGLESELALVAATWYRVFPGDRGRDGRKVEKLFVYGNHDVQRYSPEWAAMQKIPWEKAQREELGAGSRRKDVFERLFNEEWKPLWMKTVKGYRFVGSDYQYRRDRQRRVEGPGEPSLGDFLEAHRADLAGEKPFFFIQHMHPKGTCSAPWTWGQDDGTSTRALERFPNAVALTGHSHTPLNDERTLWRGTFTSVGTAALRFLIPFGGRENSEIDGAEDTGEQLMPRLRPYDGKHGMVCRVYDDRIEFERRDFMNGLSLGPDWVVPLPARAESFEQRSRRMPPPEFPAGAAVSVSRGVARSRKGVETPALFVSFPNVFAAGGRARAFDFEVCLEEMDVDAVKVRRSKRVYSAGYYRAEAADERTVTCPFALADLPPPNGPLDPMRGRRWRFSVRPCDCFGRKGAAISTDWSAV